MRWKFRGVNLKVSQALRRHAHRSVIQPLSRFGRHIRSLSLWARKNGRRQSAQEGEVLVVVTLADGRQMAIRQSDPCCYAALDQVADRVKESIRRQTERRMSRPRRRRPDFSRLAAFLAARA